jgi:hypothetical protein
LPPQFDNDLQEFFPGEFGHVGGASHQTFGTTFV